MYKRYLETEIINKAGRGKAIILVGPRQAGKTTLLRTILKSEDYLFLDGDDPKVRTILHQPDTEQLRQLIGNHSKVFIDEAQRIDGIGLPMKIIVDQFKSVQLYASGPYSFDLANKVNEPLTGRKWEYKLLPVSWEEFEKHHGFLFAEQQLENRLIYGFYPDVLNNPGDEVQILKNLVTVIYTKTSCLRDIRKSEVLDKIGAGFGHATSGMKLITMKYHKF
jgi:predicted AAA+ superfamily ATPase